MTFVVRRFILIWMACNAVLLAGWCQIINLMLFQTVIQKLIVIVLQKLHGSVEGIVTNNLFFNFNLHLILHLRWTTCTLTGHFGTANNYIYLTEMEREREGCHYSNELFHNAIFQRFVRMLWTNHRTYHRTLVTE